MKLSEVADLRTTVGRIVRSLADFSGVPKGTLGHIDEFYETGRGGTAIMVAWSLPNAERQFILSDTLEILLTATRQKPLRDGFARDPDFDETQWLELI